MCAQSGNGVSMAESRIALTEFELWVIVQPVASRKIEARGVGPGRAPDARYRYYTGRKFAVMTTHFDLLESECHDPLLMCLL